jgi:hypothetical protein
MWGRVSQGVVPSVQRRRREVVGVPRLPCRDRCSGRAAVVESVPESAAESGGRHVLTAMVGCTGRVTTRLVGPDPTPSADQARRALTCGNAGVDPSSLSAVPRTPKPRLMTGPPAAGAPRRERAPGWLRMPGRSTADGARSEAWTAVLARRHGGRRRSRRSAAVPMPSVSGCSIPGERTAPSECQGAVALRSPGSGRGNLPVASEIRCRL